MIPEGLELASAEDILESVAGVGFNFVRMYVCLSQRQTCTIFQAVVSLGRLTIIL